MTDCVVDASALVLALVGKTDSADALRRRMPVMRLHAPHLVDAEVANVLRRHERSGSISAAEARAALVVSGQVVTRRYPHVGELAQRAWALRQNLSYYDALYVSLAGYLNVPLFTADVRLSKAPGLACEIHII